MSFDERPEVRHAEPGRDTMGPREGLPSTVSVAERETGSAAMSRTPHTVVAVEDHPLFCEGLRALFRSSGDFELVGDASNGASALGVVRRLQPDIVLLDIGLPGANGLNLVMQLKRVCASC